MKTEPFRWLFTAYFDNKEIKQTPEDNHPDSNQFKPVLDKIDELVAFDLRRVGTDEVVTVDLKSGAFIINGTPVNIHEQHFDPSLHKLKLIYFREKREQVNSEATIQEDGSILYGKATHDRSFVNRYFIGWQTQDHLGKNKQALLAVG